MKVIKLRLPVVNIATVAERVMQANATGGGGQAVAPGIVDIGGGMRCGGLEENGFLGCAAEPLRSK